MLVLVLCVISALASIGTLAVVCLRPVCAPVDVQRIADEVRRAIGPMIGPGIPDAPEELTVASLVRERRVAPADRRGQHSLRPGARFHIEALNENGQPIPNVDVHSDNEPDINERWNRLLESSDSGYFTLHDKRAPGPRGQFSRGVP